MVVDHGWALDGRVPGDSGHRRSPVQVAVADAERGVDEDEAADVRLLHPPHCLGKLSESMVRGVASLDHLS